MFGKLNTRLDSFNDRMSGIEGEIGRIRRHWNIPIYEEEEEKDLGNEEAEDLGGDD